MDKYLVGGHVVAMDVRTSGWDELEAYRYTGESEPERVLTVSAELMRAAEEEWLALNRWKIEKAVLARKYFSWLAASDGMGLHASAVAYEGCAYVFTADSGTGKSTHAHLWQQAFGADRVEILNDDKPALREKDGRFYACGSPWCGKERQETNLMVPLQGICLLAQGSENRIERVAPKAAILPILRQTLLPESTAEDTERFMAMLERLVTTVPIYRLESTISEDAARLAWMTMRPAGEDEA